MGVTIRKREMAGGNIAFYLLVYHKDFGKFSQKTGIQEHPKNKRAFNQAETAAKEKQLQLQRNLQRDPVGVFQRQEVAGSDFIEYFKMYSGKFGYPSQLNTLKYLRDFTGGTLSFSNLNHVWLERFKNYLISIDGLSKNTASSYLATTKTVLRLAYREGYIETDFTNRVANIKLEDIQRHCLNFEEIERLNQSVCDNQMVKTAFLFSCFSGLRLSDVEQLKWVQLSHVNGAPYIQFRQQKTRSIETMPLTEQAMKCIQQAKDLHASYSPECNDLVFILPHRTQISILLHTWGLRSGIQWKLHFHASRHTFATLNLTEGNDLYTVSKLLGHREIKTTQIYAQISDPKKLQAVQKIPLLSPQTEQSKLIEPEKPHAAAKSTITQTLTTKGETIANALGLKKNQQGHYEFEGKQYSPIDLVLEVADNRK